MWLTTDKLVSYYGNKYGSFWWQQRIIKLKLLHCIIKYIHSCPVYTLYSTVPWHHKVHIYLEYHSVCPLVRIGTPTPSLPLASGPPSPDPKGGGGVHIRLRGRRQSQFRRLKKKHSTLSTQCMAPRKYWMIVLLYRGPGCFTVVWFGSFPTPPPLTLSNLSLLHSLSVCRRSSLPTGGGGRWWRRSQSIRRRDSLVLYKRETYTFELLYTTQVLRCKKYGPTHRVAITDFWLTFHRGGKIITLFTITDEVASIRSTWEGRYTTPVSSPPLFVLCGPPFATGGVILPRSCMFVCLSRVAQRWNYHHHFGTWLRSNFSWKPLQMRSCFQQWWKASVLTNVKE